MNDISLGGIIPAIVNPMTPNFQVDEEAFVDYVKWISRFRLGGLAVNVDSGEGPHLYREERKRTIELAADVVKGKFPIVAGLPTRFTREAVEQALELKEAGADALLVFPIPAFSGSPLPVEIPYLYHKTIGEQADISLVLFQLEQPLGGIEYPPEVLLELTKIKQIVALKESLEDAKKFVATARLLREAPRKITFLNGNDTFILEAFILGAEGALIGFATLATDLQIEMFELVQKKRYAEAQEIMDRLQPLIDAIFAPPARNYRARTKEALVMLGIIEHAYIRPPLLPISEAERKRLREALKTAGLF
ncbi:MAG: dihydrodipicolinate synthase family protein [Candidatus Bathyarchaeota archaeon]|nr:dihydrodipicolinate synthase family protein [Candidatus Bathyarchaeota archaeon]